MKKILNILRKSRNFIIDFILYFFQFYLYNDFFFIIFILFNFKRIFQVFQIITNKILITIIDYFFQILEVINDFYNKSL